VLCKQQFFNVLQIRQGEMAMKILIGAMIVILTLFISYFHAYAACCAWDDKNACASCPEGYSSGCVTEGNNCTCDCAKNENEMAQKLSKGDRRIQYLIMNNFSQIVRDTQSQGYFRSYDLPNIKITISPPERARPR
jgi:hypothetical protein